MLEHVLRHHFVVKLQRALLCQVIINLTLLRLDHVSALGIDRVGQRVVLEVDIACPLLLKEMILVLPARLLLVHKAACGASMLLSAAVELTHDLIELIVVGDR